jgi:hypothetical protein
MMEPRDEMEEVSEVEDSELEEPPGPGDDEEDEPADYPVTVGDMLDSR